MIKSTIIMLISPNLPINRDKVTQNDQILTITGNTWFDYQNFELLMAIAINQSEQLDLILNPINKVF